MRTEYWCMVTCDDCQEIHARAIIHNVPADIEDHVDNLLHMRGWRVHPVVGDICPKCNSDDQASSISSAESSSTPGNHADGEHSVDHNATSSVPDSHL